MPSLVAREMVLSLPPGSAGAILDRFGPQEPIHSVSSSTGNHREATSGKDHLRRPLSHGENFISYMEDNGK